MALIEIHRDPTPRQVRQFATVWLSGFCFVLASVAAYALASWPLAMLLAACGVASILLGIFRPAWMRLVMFGAIYAAFPVGWVVLHVLLAVLYYFVVTPMGVAMRLFGHDPLACRFDRTAQTYWSPRQQPSEPSRYFRQF